MACAGLAGVHSLNCNDLTSIVIQAILDLKIPAGATTLEIFNYVPLICPNTIVTLADIETTVALGARRGTFSRVVPFVGAEPTFLINAYMARLNVQNAIYSRNPSQGCNFFSCSGPGQPPVRVRAFGGQNSCAQWKPLPPYPPCC